MSLKRALLILVVLVLAVGTVPAWIVANNRLARALRVQVRESLAMAPDLLRARWAATVDVRMMHARDVARTPGLAQALMDEDSSGAARLVEQAGAGFPEAPILVGPDGAPLIPADSLPGELVDATRRGEMPVSVVPGPGRVRVVSLAPVELGDVWVGAAGGTSVLDGSEAATLAGLTRSEVLILDGMGGVAGASVPQEEAETLAAALEGASLMESGPTVTAGDQAVVSGRGSGSDSVSGTESSRLIREVHVGQVPYLALVAPISSTRVVFLKNLDRELSVLPLLRRIALWIGGIALALALLLGTLFAGRLARPVGSLAAAADRLAAGDFDAPLQPSGIGEVTRVSEAFDQMRRALRARLAELEAMNRELEDRQERLVVLQGELVQRDRLASAGRLLAQLAHEIRNPIASIRNCLEVLRRRTSDDPEAREFADMAIDELLRMHELTEQMLDVHRPRDPEGSRCEVAPVAQEVANLLKAGTDPGKELAVSVVGTGSFHARVAADAMKQVLLNLGLNAREAMEDEGPIEIVLSGVAGKVRVEVLDRGPGIDEEILPRIFDPFFTTKKQVHGVGLGLFTAEAIVRTYGGRIEGANRKDGPGARFAVEFPEAEDAGDPGGAAAARGQEVGGSTPGREVGHA
jgi:signal transduction histidine kinase